MNGPRTIAGGSGMCILLVEDESLIRELMAESLRDAGHDVVEVEDGAAALDAIHTLPMPLSILVTDFHMPGDVDGSQVAAQVRAIFPMLPVVIASGRPEVFQTSWQRDLGYRLIRKPYRPSELIALVRSLTGQSGASSGTTTPG